jgi:hypothetical protein
MVISTLKTWEKQRSYEVGIWHGGDDLSKMVLAQ